MTLSARIRHALESRRKGFITVSIDVEELERWKADALRLEAAAQEAYGTTNPDEITVQSSHA